MKINQQLLKRLTCYRGIQSHASKRQDCHLKHNHLLIKRSLNSLLVLDSYSTIGIKNSKEGTQTQN
jgi:hypothetical protein